MARLTDNALRNIKGEAARYCSTHGHLNAEVHGPHDSSGIAFPPCGTICARCGYEVANPNCRVWPTCEPGTK